MPKDADSSKKKLNALQIRTSLSFSRKDVALWHGDLYSTVSLSSGTPKGERGAPSLPWKTFFLSLPWGSRATGITSALAQTTTLADGVTIAPFQADALITAGTVIKWNPPNPQLYEAQGPYPEPLASVQTMRQIGDSVIAELIICPFQYYPRVKRLDFVERLDITVDYTVTEAVLQAETQTFVPGEPQHELSHLATVKKMVINPDDVEGNLRHVELRPRSSPLNGPSFEYVIITSSAMTDAFQRLANWRTAFGLPARVVKVEDILNNTVPGAAGAEFALSSGYPDGGTRDTAEAIRNFIKWAHVHWGTEYILLGGDTTIVPTRYAFTYSTAWGYYGDRISDTITQIKIGPSMVRNPANDPNGNLVVICYGPKCGTVIPYNDAPDDDHLGWHFITSCPSPHGAPGMPSAIPTHCLETRGPKDFHGFPFALKFPNEAHPETFEGQNNIPTDLYYSDLASIYPPGTHDWDENGNFIYGEAYAGDQGAVWPDGVNAKPHIYVGRAPAKGPNEAAAFVSKVINYENYQYIKSGTPVPFPPDFAVSVLLAAQPLSPYPPAERNPDIPVRGQENIRHMLLAHADPSFVNVKCPVQDRWKFTRLYDKGSADRIDKNDQCSDLDLLEINGQYSNQKLLDALQRGCNVVSLGDHGGVDCVLFVVNCQELKSISSPPGVFYAHACNTNAFDYSGGECLGETAVVHPEGGAVAFVGYTRRNWWTDEDNNRETMFWETLLTSNSGRLGEMFNAGMDGLYSINLLGDPAMRVWSDRPKQINVNHGGLICTGSQTFSVHLSPPIEHATVTVTMIDGLFFTTETDATGTAKFELAPISDGTLNVTVSGKNVIPYFGSAEVVSCGTRCKQNVVCKTGLVCTVNLPCTTHVSCKSILTCIPQLICSQKLACSRSISCAKMVNCQNVLVCGKSLVCTSGVHCLQLGGCKALLEGCNALRPEDLGTFWQIHELLGISNIDELKKRMNTPEFENSMERLPLEVKKPIQMMLKRIEQEDSLGHH